jgi:hypothetical protein
MRCTHILLACTLLLLATTPALAWFERAEVGARALALGSNFVSVADDATALYWNPAGLSRLVRHQIILGTESSVDLEGVQRGFVAGVLQTHWAAVGLGWSRTSLQDAANEDLVYLSLSRTMVQRTLGAFISLGATLKMAHVGLQTAGFQVQGLRDGDTHLTSDLALLAAPIPNIRFGIIVRNLGRPQFDLIEGGGSTALENQTEWGMTLLWRFDSQVNFSRVRNPGRATETKLGVELGLSDPLRIQMGVAHDQVTGGVGARWSDWRLQVGISAHRELGLTTRIGLHFDIGEERQQGGGGFDDF